MNALPACMTSRSMQLLILHTLRQWQSNVPPYWCIAAMLVQHPRVLLYDINSHCGCWYIYIHYAVHHFMVVISYPLSSVIYTDDLWQQVSLSLSH